MSAADKLKKRFGDNLSESLGARTTSATANALSAPATVSPDDGRTRARETGHMEIERIVPDPNQPRKAFDADSLDRLARSMQRHGQLQPIRVRWNESLAKWVVIAGERRYQAAKRAGMSSLVCVFVDRELTASEILSEQIVENLLREDLKPIEQAKAYQTLMELNGWNGSQLAEALNISKATVSRVLPLLSLSDEIKVQIDKGDLPATIAYELTKLSTVEGQQALAERIVAERFTRAEAIEAVRQVVDQEAARTSTPLAPLVNVAVTAMAGAQEFRSETNIPTASFAAKQPEGTDLPKADENANALDFAAEIPAPPTAHSPPPPKPGRPRGNILERTFRVGDARVTVRFLKKVPESAEIITALEQALAQAREDIVPHSAV